jgi:hypothetical protein
MRRRTLLRSLPVGLAGGLAGCAALGFDVGGGRGGDGSGEGVAASPPAGSATTSAARSPSASASTSATAGEPVESRAVTVRNVSPRRRYATVVVTDGGEDVLVESADLVPGRWRTFDEAVGRAGEYEVRVETADGVRASRAWVVDPAEHGSEGVEVTLDGDRIEVWPSRRCEPGCPDATVRAGADLPLIGDGTGHWFAPAGVVVRNPGAATAVDLRVSLSGSTVLDATYPLAGGAQLRVPVTFRSGRYEVRVAANGRAATSEWPVPEVPARYVRLAERTRFGCGPANTVLRLRNSDDVNHRLDVRVTAPGGGTRYERRFGLPARSEREVEPVTTSGRYDVFAATSAREGRGAWWACPPHGPATVEVDAAGHVSVRQDFREYVANPGG